MKGCFWLQKFADSHIVKFAQSSCAKLENSLINAKFDTKGKI